MIERLPGRMHMQLWDTLYVSQVRPRISDSAVYPDCRVEMIVYSFGGSTRE